VTDVAAARPIDLAIVDGITTISGGEGPGARRTTNPLTYLSPGSYSSAAILSPQTRCACA